MVNEGDVTGDWGEGRLAQVISNVASNALKYGAPTSAVTLTTRSDAEHAELCIHNFGPPIPAEALRHLFHPMHRNVATLDRADRSVGLDIVEHLVEAHGGRVTVSPTEAAGTEFVVTLPRRSPCP